MRKNFMKKAVAVTLSAAMTFSLSAVSNLTNASAAAVALQNSKKTLTVNQKFTLKLKKATQKNWKITKAVSAKPKIVKVNKKTAKNVIVKGLKKGTAKVTVTIKKKNGKGSARKLSCKFTVKKKATPTVPTTPSTVPTTPSTVPTTPSTVPTTPSTPKVTVDTAATQEELIAKLANKDLEKLTLQTEASTIAIPDGDYSKVQLIVNAPKASITNNAAFKDIEIQAIAVNTWIEKSAKGTGNIIKVTAPKASIVVDASAKIQTIELSQKTELALDIKDKATVDALNIKAASDVKIKGGSSVAQIKVVIADTAEGTKFESDVKVDLTMNALADITLTAGAADSKIAIAKALEGKDLNILNRTGKALTVLASDGKTSITIPNGNTGKVTAPTAGQTGSTTPTGPIGGDSGNTGGGTGTTPSGQDGKQGPNIIVNKLALNADATTLVTGDAVRVSGSSIIVTGGAATVTGCTITLKNVGITADKIGVDAPVGNWTIVYKVFISLNGKLSFEDTFKTDYEGAGGFVINDATKALYGKDISIKDVELKSGSSNSIGVKVVCTVKKAGNGTYDDDKGYSQTWNGTMNINNEAKVELTKQS